jgi:hypothetical protein
MKLLLSSAALFLLAAPARDTLALVYAPEEGTQLKRVFDAEAEYRLTDMTTSVNGEPWKGPDEDERPEISNGFTEHIAVTDTLAAVEDGRPTELVRTFDELGQVNIEKVDDEESSVELGSPLQGKSVRFRWDGDESTYVAEAADESDELDSDLLGALLEDMDLRLVLPKEEVEVGDTWELDPRLYLGFMWPSGLLDFQVEGEEPSAEDRGPSQQTIERLEGSGTARLEEVREEDGLRLAVIHVELEITTGSESVLAAESTEESESPEVTVEVEIERTLEGTILWDLEHGHAHSAELECESSRLTTRSFTYTLVDVESEQELSAEIEESILLEGKIRYVATIERL